MEAVINDYISRELIQDPNQLPRGNATPHLETRVLDSLSRLMRVLFVQERFGIVVDDADLLRKHLASVDAICGNLGSNAGGRVGKAGGHG